MGKDITIYLTRGEALLAAVGGIMRRLNCLYRGIPRGTAADENEGFGHDTTGAVGELALAKHLGLYWHPSIGESWRVDVGPFEVKATTLPYGRLLIAKPDEVENPLDMAEVAPLFNLELAYVLVTGLPPRVVIRGWTWGKEIICPEQWGTWGRPDRPCWGMEQRELKPMADFLFRGGA